MRSSVSKGAIALSLLAGSLTPVLLVTTPASATDYVAGDLVTGQTVGDPAVEAPVLAVGLSGTTVGATYDGLPGVWTRDLAGGSEWSQASSAPFADPRQKAFSFAHGTVLTPMTGYPYQPSYTLDWPGHTRVVDPSYDHMDLAHGGDYLVHISRSSGALSRPIENARTGAPVPSPHSRADVVVDDAWAWTGPGADGLLRGTNLVTGGRDTQRAGCLNGELLDVQARWALVDCHLAPSSGSQKMVVDLGGVLGSQWVGSHGMLGDGFMVYGQGQSGPPTLTVQSLTGAHEVREYGPLRGSLDPGGSDMAVNDDGSDLVYVDPDSRLRHVDLSWAASTPRPAPDTTGPIVTLTSPLGAYNTNGGSVALDWSVADTAAAGQKSSGARSIDVRRRAQGGETWEYPPAWQGQLLASTYRLHDLLAPNAGTCWSARGTDSIGNTSQWTTPVCQYLDATPPVAGAEGSLPEFVPWRSGSLSYTWSSPSRGPLTYDVGTRSAAAGRALGSWTTPIGTQRLASTQRTFPVSGAGTQRCLRFRAVSDTGVSAWSPGRCTALPTDDRSLARKGTTSPAKSSLAIAGTYTKLAKKGSSVTLAKPAGRKVGVWLLRGPGQGTANVYAGTRLIGRVSGASSKNVRTLTVLAPRGGFAGAVRIVQAGTKPVKVDGVAVLR